MTDRDDKLPATNAAESHSGKSMDDSTPATHEQLLSAYLDLYKDLPPQGSDAWKQNRVNSFGGSEVAALLDLSPFKTRRDLILSKITHESDFRSTPAMNWGKLFEDVTIAYIEYTWGIVIHEAGSLPGSDSKFTYSPDGLAVAVPPGENSKKIILFEIKDPKSRIPTGIIPPMYVPQPIYGLMIIPIAQMAFFVDACYRKCAYEAMDDDATYDTQYHRSDPRHEPARAKGMVGIYLDTTYSGFTVSEDREYIYHLDEDMLDMRRGLPHYEVHDFGASDKSTFDNMLDRIGRRLYKSYIPAMHQSVDDQLFDFLDFCQDNDYIAIGIVPWKLFEYYEIRVDPNEDMCADIVARVKESYSIVDACRNAENPATEFAKYYPESGNPELSNDELLAVLDTMTDELIAKDKENMKQSSE